MAPRDPRWILLTSTGGYSTLGRHREPSPQDLAQVLDSLERAGLAGGWVAILSASEYSTGPLELVEVCALGQPPGSFHEAADALLARRAERSGGQLE